MRSLPVYSERVPRRGLKPGRAWRWSRRVALAVTFYALILAPLLGGWQRLDRNYLGAWDGHGWDLPAGLLNILPVGEPAATAYSANVAIGGGSGASFASVPAIDPVSGALALAATSVSDVSWLVVLAWLLPLLLAFVAGRVFCGWLCPFGTLARGLESLLERLPFHFPRYALPRRRWHRFVLLAGALVAGALGSQLLLSATLPHLLVQQSIYSVWLMGGGGAAAGALVGLLLAGVAFGPTTYCAVLCPTGAALSIPGRRRVVRLKLVEPTSCGHHCDLCDRACWLSLSPSTGDPGPDCDTCGRCVEVCPRDNLEVGVGAGPRRVGATLGAAALAVLAFLAAPKAMAETSDPGKPRLLLDAHRVAGELDVYVAVVDVAGIELDVNDGVALDGVELSVSLFRGPRGAPDERGRLPKREVHEGSLTVELLRPDGSQIKRMHFTAPTDPRSTPRRSIFRRRIPVTLRPGDRVVIAPIAGWIDAPAEWVIPERNVGANRWRGLGFLAAGFLVFGGMISLTLGAQRTSAERRRTRNHSA